MVWSYISSPPHLYILERSSELLVDTYVVYLVLCLPQSCASGSLVLLAGSTMPDWSVGEGQTKKYSVGWGLGVRPVFSSQKTSLATETPMRVSVQSCIFFSAHAMIGQRKKNWLWEAWWPHVMVSALDSWASDPGLSPGRGHCAVFLSKTLYSQWVPANVMLGGNPAMDKHPTQEGSRNTPSHVML